MLIKELNNQHVLVWGLGKEAQACITSLYSRARAKWSVFSDQPLSQSEIEFLAEYPAIRKVETLTNDFIKHDLDVIIKSPGVSLYRPELELARRCAVKITSGTNIWFAENPQAFTIGVTGTKGKSTTSSLITHLLRAQGKSVALAGNIGKPLISWLKTKESIDYWVIELSSYQLADFTGSLNLAVLLNLYPEHLDWHGSQQQYFADKANITRQLKPTGLLITNQYLNSQLKLVQQRPPLEFDTSDIKINGRTISIGAEKTTLPDMVLPGPHNLLNAAAAISVGRELGLSPSKLLSGLSDFQPLPHRLQPVAEQQGVLYVNDSISTIPESAVAAVNLFANRGIVLILGGLLRNQNWTNRVAALCQPHVRAIICLGENATHIVQCISERKATKSSESPQTIICENLEQAVTKAKQLARSGDVVLLSPGSASYDQFKNFEERGLKFEELVVKLG